MKLAFYNKIVLNNSINFVFFVKKILFINLYLYLHIFSIVNSKIISLRKMYLFYIYLFMYNFKRQNNINNNYALLKKCNFKINNKNRNKIKNVSNFLFNFNRLKYFVKKNKQYLIITIRGRKRNALCNISIGSGKILKIFSCGQNKEFKKSKKKIWHAYQSIGERMYRYLIDSFYINKKRFLLYPFFIIKFIKYTYSCKYLLRSFLRRIKLINKKNMNYYFYRYRNKSFYKNKNRHNSKKIK